MAVAFSGLTLAWPAEAGACVDNATVDLAITHARVHGSGPGSTTISVIDGRISRSQQLEAMTTYAASVFGQNSDIGSIVVGQRADLVIIHSNTSTDSITPASIVMVVQDGRIVIDRR